MLFVYNIYNLYLFLQQTISAESAKNKCKNFLSTLLKLASEQKQPVAKNVRNLIQGLIDSKVEPEAFTEELQKDLNSSPQPCLVPFLRVSLRVHFLTTLFDYC